MKKPGLTQRLRLLVCSMAMLLLALPALADRPRVLVSTNMGDFTLELDQDKAPKTVANFLRYVEDGQYDGTVFHRVIKNFMIQGGGLRPDLTAMPTRSPVVNEANNGLRNERGTIAMARTSEPHSATSQFFINTVDNGFLNFPAQDGWGYCVFGKVMTGMDVIDKIRVVQTRPVPPHQNVPVTPVVIKRMTLTSGARDTGARNKLDTEGLEQAIEDWRQAWEARDLSRYLDYYSPRFRAGELEQEAWSRQKRASIGNRSWIKLEIQGLKLEQGKGPYIQATFEQDYRADNLADRTRKRQHWANENGRWKIIYEGAN